MSGAVSAVSAAGAVAAAAEGATTIGTIGAALSANAAGIATIASLGGSALSAMGQMKQADAAKQSAAFNANIASQNANKAAQAGEINVTNQQMKTRAQMGAIETAQAAKGIDISSGSAQDVQKSSAELGQLNALSIRSQAAQQAYGYQTAAAIDTATAQNTSDLGAMGTAASGLAKTGMEYANWASTKGITQ